MDTEACYDASGDGEHCICGYNPPNGEVGCCTGTLQIDMGGGITGNFDYVGWDAQFNKPYYRTKACLRFRGETSENVRFSEHFGTFREHFSNKKD